MLLPWVKLVWLWHLCTWWRIPKNQARVHHVIRYHQQTLMHCILCDNKRKDLWFRPLTIFSRKAQETKKVFFVTFSITLFTTVSTVVFDFILFQKIRLPKNIFCNSTNGQYFALSTTVRNHSASKYSTKILLVKNSIVDKKWKNSVLSFSKS